MLSPDDDGDDDDHGDDGDDDLILQTRSPLYPTPIESCAYFGTLIPDTSFKLEVGMQKSEPCSFGCDSSCQPTPRPLPPFTANLGAL